MKSLIVILTFWKTKVIKNKSQQNMIFVIAYSEFFCYKHEKVFQ